MAEIHRSIELVKRVAVVDLIKVTWWNENSAVDYGQVLVAVWYTVSQSVPT